MTDEHKTTPSMDDGPRLAALLAQSVGPGAHVEWAMKDVPATYPSGTPAGLYTVIVRRQPAHVE